MQCAWTMYNPYNTQRASNKVKHHLPFSATTLCLSRVFLETFCVPEFSDFAGE